MLSLLLIFTLAFIVSCSGESENLVTPETGGRDVVAAEGAGATVSLGLWQFVADKATGNIDIVQLRNADKIINVLGFMEPPPLTLMDLDWANLDIDFVNGTVDVGVILTHPIAGDPVFTGFDVRGVCFGPKVTNADGLTIIPGPEYFCGVPFGYQDGLLGAPDSFGNYEGLAGYKYYCDDLGADDDLVTFFSNTGNLDNRGMFGAGETNQRDFELDWNGTGYDILVFNYAIYANYDWPVGDPPINIDNFEITSANSAEAFCCDFNETANSLWYSLGVGGGSISLEAEIWDWQGDITDVTIESLEPGIIVEAPYNSLVAGSTAYSSVYGFTSVAGNPTSAGILDIIVTAVDAKTFGEHWFLDLLDSGHAMYNENIYNCFLYAATVMECPQPTVTSIVPSLMSAGSTVTDAEVTGTNFIAGTLLEVRLKMTGETDVIGTNASVTSGTTIEVDFNLTGAAEGFWDVVVTNGCGTDGTGTELVEIFDCGSMQTGSGGYYNVTNLRPSDHCGITCTRTGTSYVVASTNGTHLYAKSAMSGHGNASINVYMGGLNRRDLSTDSADNIYFTISPYNSLRYVPWNGSSFGTVQTFGNVPAGSIWRICVDDNDNPIVLVYTSLSAMTVYHHNGTDWDSATVPSAIIGGNFNNVRDFDYNPMFGHYVFVSRPAGNYTNLYAVDSAGDIAH